MAFLDFLIGKRGKVKQQPTMNPQQMALLNQLLGQQQSGYQSPLMQQGQSYLSSILSGGPEAFSAYEAPALRQFNEQILPDIAEYFSGLGASSSSGLNQTLGQAGAGLAERLAAQRAGLRSDAYNQVLQGQGLQQQQGQALLGVRPFENVYQQGQPGLLSLLGAGIGTGLGAGLGNIGSSYLTNRFAPRFGGRY